MTPYPIVILNAIDKLSEKGVKKSKKMGWHTIGYGCCVKLI